jgi:peptidoglycan-associated lipoprotein
MRRNGSRAFCRKCRVSAAFPPRGVQTKAGTRGRGPENNSLTMFLEPRLTATWLLVAQRNTKIAKERRDAPHRKRLPLIPSRWWRPGRRRLRLEEDPQQRRRPRPRRRGAATPGSAQDFTVNVGDRIFFDTDSSAIRADAQQTLSKQAQWLNQYGSTDRRRRPCRRARHARIQPRARRPPRRRDPRLPDRPRRRRQPHEDHLLRQGAPVAVCDDISCWSQNRRAVTVLNGAGS